MSSKKIKVLWLTHVIPSAVLRRQQRLNNGTGFWVSSLLEQLCGDPEVELVVGYESDSKIKTFIESGVRYDSIPRMSRVRLLYHLNYRKGALKTVLAASRLAEEVQPHVIHIHGMESSLGLYGLMVGQKIPICVSLQGLMGPCSEVPWGDKSFLDIVKLQCLCDARRGFYALGARRRFKAGAKREKDVVRSSNAVMGRTEFDREYIRSISNKVDYFHVGELMRSEFYENCWSLETKEPLRIFSSGRLTFQKGFHVMIEAIAILRHSFPDMRVIIAGGDDPTGEFIYFENKIRDYGMNDIFEFPGVLNSQNMVKELLRANVYVNPSFVENSSNALCEAMLVGTPVVASFVGGTPSLVEHNRTGQLYPVNRPELLALCIRRIFEDGPKFSKMAEVARGVAQNRHSPQTVKAQLLYCYRALVMQH